MALNITEKKSRDFFSGNTSLGRPYHLKFLKGCLPQILRGPILNTLAHIFQRTSRLYHPSFFKCCCPQILYGQFSNILSQIALYSWHIILQVTSFNPQNCQAYAK